MPVCPICGDENPQLGAVCPRDQAYYIYESAVNQAKTDPMIGQLAAKKYVIVGRISKGGMGAVYRALQLPVEREVAFKVLRAEVEDSSQSRDRFIREARAVSRLSHSNIITLYDFGFQANGQPYMVMEYAPGVSLAEWLQKGDLSFGRIMGVCRQLLSALAEAHEQGIVHRDLKPENMIVTRRSSGEEELKLLDFGIARMINETSTRGLTREGEVFGTPHYMSPEQAQGAKEVGPRADIYAVGIMLYELISGEAPYDAPTPLAVLLKHINEPMPPLVPRKGVVVPPGFSAVLNKAVAKDPSDRYETATAMLYAMSEWYNPSVELHHSVFQSSPQAAEREMPTIGGDVEVGQLYDPAGLSSAERLRHETVIDPVLGQGKSKKMIWASVAVLLLIGGVAAMLFAMEGPQPKEEVEAPQVELEVLKEPAQVMVQHNEPVRQDITEDHDELEPAREAATNGVEVGVKLGEPPQEVKDTPVKEPEAQETQKVVVKTPRKPRKPRQPVVEEPAKPKEPVPEVTKWGVDTPKKPKKPVIDKW